MGLEVREFSPGYKLRDLGSLQGILTSVSTSNEKHVETKPDFLLPLPPVPAEPSGDDLASKSSMRFTSRAPIPIERFSGRLAKGVFWFFSVMTSMLHGVIKQQKNMDLHVGIFGLMRYGIVFIHNQPEQLALQLGVLTLFGASQEDLWTFGWDRPGSDNPW